MAAFDRPKTATYEDHETIWVDTEDHEDHTFCGVIFPIKAKKYLPVERILVHSISVRGRLGPISIHVSNPTTTSTTRIPLEADHWTKIYEGKHKMVRRGYCKLELAEPLVMSPGDVRLIYVHSTLDGDESIVYDNTSNTGPRYEDDFISIHSGKAHLSPEPFGQTPIWGWGNAWRDRREFVGQIAYGVVYKLWDPENHRRFGDNFSAAVQAMLVSQRRYPVGKIPDECLYYIMNMCKWDWFNDTGATFKAKYRSRKVLAKSEPDISEAAEETDDEEMDDDDDAREAWERFNGYHANSQISQLEALSSDEEEPVLPDPRNRWFSRNLTRIRIFPRFDHDLSESDGGAEDMSSDDDDFEDSNDDESLEMSE